MKRKEKNLQIFFFLFSLFLIFFFLFSNLKLLKKKIELNEKIRNLNSQIQILEDEKRKLEAEISKTQRKEYWEELAREEGYAREGEEVIVIKKVAQNTKEEAKNLKEKIWEILKEVFKK